MRLIIHPLTLAFASGATAALAVMLADRGSVGAVWSFAVSAFLLYRAWRELVWMVRLSEGLNLHRA